ncbi:MAG: hypothetical protein ACYSUT_12725 [Planctomycetota bacterium]|jgi:hypothetical protein
MPKKMCKLTKDKLQKDDPKKFKKIVKGAKYYCKSCGHVACKESHLCKPEEL